MRFQCAVAGHPDPWATWEKDGTQISPSSKVTIMEREDLRILEISDVKQSDSGLYKVVLENDLGKIEASARLEVIAHRSYYSSGLRARSSSPRPAPTHRRTYNTSSARYGSNARLFYDIRGVPTPFLKWYKDGVPLEYSQKHEIYFDDSGFHLDIVDVDETDEGVYSVKDEQNLVDYRNELEVIGIPERRYGSYQSGVSKKSSRNREILLVDDKDSYSFDETTRKGVDTLKNNQNTLEFQNELKTTTIPDRKTKDLQDFSPPRITKKLAPIIRTNEGSSTFLEVVVEGPGPFDVVWMKDGCVLPDCEDFRQEVRGGVVSLLIADTFPEDAGKYRCEVYNVFGEDMSKCTVEVKGELVK